MQVVVHSGRFYWLDCSPPYGGVGLCTAVPDQRMQRRRIAIRRLNYQASYLRVARYPESGKIPFLIQLFADV